MVVVAQLAEHWIVVPGVAGSSPVFHPQIAKCRKMFGYLFLFTAPCWHNRPAPNSPPYVFEVNKLSLDTLLCYRRIALCVLSGCI